MSTDLITTEPHPAWESARQILTGIQQALRVSLAGQVLLGQELSNLKKDLGFTHGANKGGPSGQFVHTERTWSEWVKTELGISYKTADRMILMFEAAKARVKKLGITGDLPGGSKKLMLLFDSRPSGMSEDDREKLARCVEKLTDGASQAILLEELRLVKMHVPIQGGDTSQFRKDKVELTVEQLSFMFVTPIYEDNRKLLLAPELPTYLVNLPLDSDDDHDITLTSLETQYRMMLQEIETAKAHKIRDMKKAR